MIVIGMDLLRRWYVYVDLLRGTVVEVSSSKTTTGPLPEEDLYFWLGVMAVFDSAEDSDSEYYNVTLLEHATPTAFTTHPNPVFDEPTTVTTTPSSPYPKSMPVTSLLVNFVERSCSLDFEKTTTLLCKSPYLIIMGLFIN